MIAGTLGCIFLLQHAMAQIEGVAPLGERLGNRTEALMEMSRIGQVYQATDLLNYNISYDFADSAALSVILEHKEGKYALYNNLFWGIVDSSMEYLQGQQYYVVADHDTKSIYVYDKLNYSRIINVPLLDSLFNEVSLKDLILTRPGGIFKKLSIQYLPNNQYHQIEMVYDSTTYLLKSIAYYYDAAIYSQAYYNCMDTVTALAVPSTGIAMPGTVTCANLVKTYRNFIAEFPAHTKGATVRMYNSQGSVAYNNRAETASASQELKELWIVPQAASRKDRPRRDTITPPPPSKRNMKASLMALGSWVDSTMTSMQLFEWYMNEHLGVQYTGDVYTDWLVNTCGYKLSQLPYSETTIVRQDTLQNIWNRFVTRYPVSQLTITETVDVPVIKGVTTNTMYPPDGYDGEYMQASTWTNGSWYISRSANTYDLSVLPKNASIQSAALSLYAYNPSWFHAPHFRYANQYPYMQLQPVKGVFIPGKTSYDIRPEAYAGMPSVNLPPTSTNQVPGGGGDFWSNQDYLSQSVTSMVSAMYNKVQTTGVNYPLEYKLNDESYVYKNFYFGGVECSNVAKRPVLSVGYTAGRCDVFTAFVNRALGTYLSYDQVIELFKFSGKLDVNSNCTTATAGAGCEGDPGKAITGVTTILFNKIDETTLDLNFFNEARFIYKVGETFMPQSMYTGYTVIPVLGGN
jgi:hypothetical protein